MTLLNLKWAQCEGGVWCDFMRVNLDGVSAEGVYVIWHVGNPGKVVRVGQGSIAQRLRAHRADPAITKYGNMKVTWAVVAAHNRDGVERYLADRYSPLVGDAFPNAVPVAVNLPGAA
jgi:hypothetical protein